MNCEMNPPLRRKANFKWADSVTVRPKAELLQRKGIRAKMDIQVGDILKLKKQHPCGSKEWEVLRIGADFRLKCMGCGHQIMIARRQVEKNVKEIKSGSGNKAIAKS